jgi:hypothetical protein
MSNNALIKIDPSADSSFPFDRFNFVVPCVSDFLSHFELFQFYQCSSDLKLQISVLWKGRAVKLGLLGKETQANGLKECLTFTDSHFQGKSYKTYIRKRFLLELEDIKHILEPTTHKVHGSCHVVRISEAFRICSRKYDGIDNFLKIKKQKEEEERQKLLKFMENKKTLFELLNLFSNKLSEVENNIWSSRLEELRHSLEIATTDAQLASLNVKFEVLKEANVRIQNNLDIFKEIFTCNLYSLCDDYLDLDFGEEMKTKFLCETNRLNMIKSHPIWKKFKKLSLSTTFQCRSFVRGELDNFFFRIEYEDEYKDESINIGWAKLKGLLDEEDWLITNTRFSSIKSRELEADEEYEDEMAGYGSGGWESEDEDKNSAMIDHDVYKFKRKLALSEYLAKHDSLDLSLIPSSLRAESSQIFHKTRTARQMRSKYKNLPSGISQSRIEEFDNYIEKAISKGSCTTPTIREAWIRKIIHQMAQDRQLYTKTTKNQIFISKYRIIVFVDP